MFDASVFHVVVSPWFVFMFYVFLMCFSLLLFVICVLVLVSCFLFAFPAFRLLCLALYVLHFVFRLPFLL